MSHPDSSPTLSPGRTVSNPWRIPLIFLGLALVCISLAALVYLYWPVEPSQLQATLQPTFFVAP